MSSVGPKVRLEKRFIRIHIINKRVSGSYWFRPFLLIILGLFLSRAALLGDQILHGLGYNLEDLWWVAWFSPLDSVRNVLVNSASVLLGLFGVLLSLALIPLTIATSSYGNVILSNFLRDKGTQNVIGYFALVIFYDITTSIALPLTITVDNYPGISITFSLIFLMGALIATVYFFNHIAHLLQATYVSKSVADELMRELEGSFVEGPAELDQGRKKGFDELRETIAERGVVVRSTGHGYVSGVDHHYIMNKAELVDATVLILKLPGDYVAQDEPLAKYLAKGQLRPRAFSRAVNRAYILGVSRTVMQDIDFGVQLLATIASRALSPALNDPVTAIICIDKIGQVLSKAASMSARSPYFLDERGELRLIADPDDFESLMATGFNQIRQYGCRAYEVMCHALQATETISYAARSPHDREVIRCHADLIMQEALSNLTSEWSKAQVMAAYRSAVKAIGSP
jgi:uncharacterized membrane protein